MTGGRGEVQELRALVVRAQNQLAGLQDLCKLSLLRVGQIEIRSPDLNGLVEPMEWEIVEILEGIVGCQSTHAEMERVVKRIA